MPKFLTAAPDMFVVAVGAIVIGALALATAGIAHAAPPSQSGSLEVRVQRLTMINDFEDNIKTTFGRGARIRTEVELRDLRDPASIAADAPDYRTEYILSFSVNTLRRGTIHKGGNDPANLNTIMLAPGEEGTFNIYWNLPYDFADGDYKFRVEVSKAGSAHAIEHYLEREFRVGERSGYVHISKNRYDFGNIDDEETPRNDSIFVAPLNPQAGDLTWRVTEWPTEWLYLIEPRPDPDDPTQSVEKVNNGLIVLQVKETALFGNFQNDEVVVSTNAGDYTIKVSGNIDRHPGGKISDFRIRPPRQNDAGDMVKFRYRIDNIGRTNLLYRVTFIVTSPTNTTIYDSSIVDKDAFVEVNAGERSGIQEYEWQIPHGATDGIYRVGVQLRNAYKFGSAVYSSIEPTASDAVTFSVLEGPLLGVSPKEMQFGTVESAQQAQATFAVTNIGRLALEWQVTSVPDWAELVSPLESVTGDGVITLRIRENTAPGSYLGAMTIESNGGSASVRLGVNIPRTIGQATRTPTNTPMPSATPASTDTPMSTATPAPANTPMSTATPVPVRTDTPVPTATPTHTSTPTATSAPQPTATPTQTDTPAPTATQEPTATPSPQPTSTRQPTATPAPTNTPEPPTSTPEPPTATPEPPATAQAPPPTAIQPGVSDTPPGGACSGSSEPASPLTGVASVALLLLPLALAGGAKLRRRRGS